MVTCQAQECRRRATNPLLVTLYLTEEQVAELLTPADAVETIERCFERMARGTVENHPRYRLRLERGALAVMAASDLELGYAGAKVYAGFNTGTRFVVVLYRTASPELVAVIDGEVYVKVIVRDSSGLSMTVFSSGPTPSTWKLTRFNCTPISGDHGVRRLKGAFSGSGIGCGISSRGLLSAPVMARSTPFSLYLASIHDVATAPRFDSVACQ
jgi:hypothetical protein